MKLYFIIALILLLGCNASPIQSSGSSGSSPPVITGDAFVAFVSDAKVIEFAKDEIAEVNPTAIIFKIRGQRNTGVLPFPNGESDRLTIYASSLSNRFQTIVFDYSKFDGWSIEMIGQVEGNSFDATSIEMTEILARSTLNAAGYRSSDFFVWTLYHPDGFLRPVYTFGQDIVAVDTHTREVYVD